MKHWWRILGVERNTDLRTVKRAYAAKLKTIRQDENPAEFMELRSAYDAARGHIRYRETEEQGVRQEPVEGVEDITIDPDWQVVEQDVAEPADIVHTPTIVEQLMDEVHALINSPWGAGNVGSWAALLDDERLDDIDVYSDFENALLNYMLNIHGFFDEDADIPPKLDLAIAFLVFKRFGWQENRNSVHFNPVVYDWLADKFFRQHEGTARGDLVNLGIDPDDLEDIYIQHEPNHEHAPPPATGGFGNWFDDGGKYVFLGIVFLIFIANLASNSSRNEVKNSPAYEEAMALIKGETTVNWDCDRFEKFALNFGALNGSDPAKHNAEDNIVFFSDDPMELSTQLEKLDLSDDNKQDFASMSDDVWGKHEPFDPQEFLDQDEFVKKTMEASFNRAENMRANIRQQLATCRAAEQALRVEETKILERNDKPEKAPDNIEP